MVYPVWMTKYLWFRHSLRSYSRMNLLKSIHYKIWCFSFSLQWFYTSDPPWPHSLDSITKPDFWTKWLYFKEKWKQFLNIRIIRRLWNDQTPVTCGLYMYINPSAPPAAGSGLHKTPCEPELNSYAMWLIFDKRVVFWAKLPKCFLMSSFEGLQSPKCFLW